MEEITQFYKSQLEPINTALQHVYGVTLDDLIKKYNEPAPLPVSIEKKPLPVYLTRLELANVFGFDKENIRHWEKKGLKQYNQKGNVTHYDFKVVHRFVMDKLSSKHINKWTSFVAQHKIPEDIFINEDEHFFNDVLALQRELQQAKTNK